MHRLQGSEAPSVCWFNSHTRYGGATSVLYTGPKGTGTKAWTRTKQREKVDTRSLKESMIILSYWADNISVIWRDWSYWTATLNPTWFCSIYQKTWFMASKTKVLPMPQKLKHFAQIQCFHSALDPKLPGGNNSHHSLSDPLIQTGLQVLSVRTSGHFPGAFQVNLLTRKNSCGDLRLHRETDYISFCKAQMWKTNLYI